MTSLSTWDSLKSGCSSATQRALESSKSMAAITKSFTNETIAPTASSFYHGSKQAAVEQYEHSKRRSRVVVAKGIDYAKNVVVGSPADPKQDAPKQTSEPPVVGGGSAPEASAGDTAEDSSAWIHNAHKKSGDRSAVGSGWDAAGDAEATEDATPRVPEDEFQTASGSWTWAEVWQKSKQKSMFAAKISKKAAALAKSDLADASVILRTQVAWGGAWMRKVLEDNAHENAVLSGKVRYYSKDAPPPRVARPLPTLSSSTQDFLANTTTAAPPTGEGEGLKASIVQGEGSESDEESALVEEEGTPPEEMAPQLLGSGEAKRFKEGKTATAKVVSGGANEDPEVKIVSTTTAFDMSTKDKNKNPTTTGAEDEIVAKDETDNSSTDSDDVRLGGVDSCSEGVDSHLKGVESGSKRGEEIATEFAAETIRESSEKDAGDAKEADGNDVDGQKNKGKKNKKKKGGN